MNVQIEPIQTGEKIPFALLELADPSRTQIESYFTAEGCFVARAGTETVGVLVMLRLDAQTAEVKNIAISESEQGKGYGKALLRYADQVAKEWECETLLIGTGNSSIGQLALYQKAGFEIQRIEKDFFLRHYEEPIWENGIQCKHMVMLEKRLG